MTLESRSAPKETALRQTVSLMNPAVRTYLMLLPASLLISIFAGYFGRTFLDALVFQPNDGWCDLEASDGVGVHCFGDFAHPFNTGGFNNFYESGNIAAVNPPVVLLLHRYLQLFEFNSALTIYLGLGLLAWLSMTQLRILQMNIYVILFIFTNAGFLAAFDRANPIIFVVPLLALFMASVNESPNVRTAIGAASLCLLKFWTPLVLLPLVFLRRFKLLVLGAGITISSTLAALFLHGDGVLHSLKITYGEVTSESSNSSWSMTAISLDGFAKLLARLHPFGENIVTISQVFSPAFVILCFILSGFFWRRGDSWEGWLALMLIPLVGLPSAQVYNLAILVPLAIFAPLSAEEESRWRRLLGQLTGFLLLPHGFLLQDLGLVEAGPTRIQTVLVPVVAVGMAAVLVIQAVSLNRANQRHDGQSPV